MNHRFSERLKHGEVGAVVVPGLNPNRAFLSGFFMFSLMGFLQVPRLPSTVLKHANMHVNVNSNPNVENKRCVNV